jgi:hypothetical protein
MESLIKYKGLEVKFRIVDWGFIPNPKSEILTLNAFFFYV